ncbi:uncharacterized protein C16orf46 homolog [Octodon degus]|uniref:Uncharacterized protein C16orf46 homolog n=1 Tax=Octodon degus TaxID=10160 RepID=A0A6P6DYZ9_OCTDE|nr:uncharacterized protein C16orf46 homolog [Octodon degus]XP_023565204.1 uncharacterized protein C16orf46 homolog [Octodon degus]XP_023565205.1 uncharacterized protein C16orf46 homolog [Octodon degus]XP_023565206.1 uncharacterized protein C16orf46 homolog [Octodon degus]
MELCQESETDLENNENNEIQSPEETELTFTCADERSEKNHVYCLLDISDLTLEEDTRSDECAIGTGWEEAVQGWGKTAPTACVWPRKKLKKARGGDRAGPSCLLCASLSPGSSEARPPSEPKKVEAGAAVQAQASVEKNQDWKAPAPFRGPSTAPREAGRVCLPSDIPEGKKSLQIKEFTWRAEGWAVPGVRGAAAEGAAVASDSPNSKALVVLPPLGASPQNRPAAPSGKSKNCQPKEGAPSADKEESEAVAHELKTADGKGEPRPFALAGHPPPRDALPIAVSVPVPAARSPLADAERCCLGWSLPPGRNSGCPPHPSALPYLATLQLLQKRGLQNYKLKARGLGAPRNSPKLALPAARPRVLETDMLPKSLLPALTVSRVVIPVSTHRVL